MNEFINDLFNYQDINYKKFQQRLLNNQDNIIGIRTPILKDIAKKISKDDYLNYFNNCQFKYYEDTVIYGLIITYLKDFDESILWFKKYIKHIDNWASCDIIVANYKLWSKNLKKGLTYIDKFLNDKNAFIKRVGLVLLLDYYINDEYIDTVLNYANNIDSDEYYVKMANAWLISLCLIKYYDKTIIFLKNCKLDDWTYNKALQKGIESYRIKNKDALKKLKR